LAAHVMVSEPPQFLINKRRQFSESGIVSITPSLQEIGHSLLRKGRHVHNRWYEAYQTFSARGSAVGRAGDEHFADSFAFYRKWKANP